MIVGKPLESLKLLGQRGFVRTRADCTLATSTVRIFLGGFLWDAQAASNLALVPKLLCQLQSP